eukprot:SAG25_NODE_14508_length_254_cov_0.670968_1_plen_43_part_10
MIIVGSGNRVSAGNRVSGISRVVSIAGITIAIAVSRVWSSEHM